MRKSLPTVLLLSGLMFAVTIHAEAAADDAPAKATTAKDGDKVRRDPKGQTGISPYNEALAAGRKAYAGGDPSAAVAAFKKAVALDGDNMYGYLLLSQAQLAADDRKAAAETAQAARKKSGTEAVQAKLLLYAADLEESEANVPPPGVAPAGTKPTAASLWASVKEAWSAYSVFLTAHASLPDYKASADARKKLIDDRIERDKKFGEVKVRIAADAAKGK